MIPPSNDVDVTTEYVVEQSDPAEERYVFAYTIVISHRSGDRCQLLNRFWRITDGGARLSISLRQHFGEGNKRRQAHIISTHIRI